MYAGSIGRTMQLDLSAWGPLATVVWNWLAVLLLWAHVFRVEKLGWSSLRLTRPTERDLSVAGWLGGASVLWHWIAARWAVPQASQSDGDATLMALAPLAALVLVLTTSFTEEVLWRGYVVERLSAWVNPLVAATVGLTVFALPHVHFFGWTWLVTGLPGAICLYVLLLWRRNLWACILAHLVGNVPVAIAALLS